MSRSMTTEDLALRIDDPARAPFVLDVRAPDQYERWRIEGAIPLTTLNIPYWTALTDLGEIVGKLPEHQEVVVVCAHGGSSGMIAEMVDLANVHNLEGGMDAWANTLVPRTMWSDTGQFVVQLDRVAKACLSYAIGSRGREMAVIDPAGDLEPYLAIAEEEDATITRVFDTHLHADHVSLGRALAERTGAAYHLSPGDGEGAAYHYEPLQDGDVFRFGGMELIVRTVATPGHTPGSTSLEVAGRFLMTGDAVFVSGVGRPDLGGETEPWARDLYETIHTRLAALDVSLEVCPAHYSARTEAHRDGIISRELGDLLANDPVVSIADADEFVGYVVEHLGEPPEVYDRIRRVNLGLAEADAETAKELEVGRNECALSA